MESEGRVVCWGGVDGWWLGGEFGELSPILEKEVREGRDIC